MRLTKLKRKLGIGTSTQNAHRSRGNTAQLVDKKSSEQTEAISTDPIGNLEPPISSNDDVPIRELWHMAYERLRKEDEHLIRDYEAKVQENLGIGLIPTVGSQIGMRDRMHTVLRQKMDEVNRNTWKIRFGSSEIQVKDLAETLLGTINWANEYITGVLRPNPYASMAWAGVSLLLPLFLNSSKQAASLAEGLKEISFLIVQSRIREDLYVRQFEAKAHARGQDIPAIPHHEYKSSLEMLYREILRFQAASYCHYASNDAFRLGLDMVKWTDWHELLGRVHAQERNFAAVEALWRDFQYDEECSAAERRHQESLHQWSEMGTDLSSLRSAVERAQAEKSRFELLHWLCDVDPSEMYNAARDKHGAGTGEWLTKESEEFKAWEESPASLLWLHGNAGAGKSVLSSVVIHHLQAQCASNPSMALAFFFFSFSDLKKQKVSRMLSSLVKQLCSRRPDTPQPIKNLSEYKEKGQRPNTETLESILMAVARGFSSVYIVIDALDECPSLEGERKRLLRSLRQIMAVAPANLHIFCTSRKEADIDAVMSHLMCPPPKAAVIDLNAQRQFLDRDIGSFIDLTLASDGCRSWPDSIRAEARKSLMEKADGMFQYVVSQLEALQRLSSARQIPFRSQIISCLKWLAFSNRTLRLEELAEIFILRPESALPLDESDRLFLVVQTIPGYGTDYLVSSRIREGPAKGFALNEVDAHLHIAHCCLAYYLQPGAMADRDETGFRLSKYAAVEWPSHLEMVPRASWPAEVTQAAIQALTSKPRYDRHLLLFPNDFRDQAQMMLPPPCYTARYGFLQLTDMLLSQGTNVSENPTQHDLDAVFHNAAFGGHMAIVRLILDKGADVNSKSNLYGDALQAAAFRGHVATVSLLLDCHADPNAQRGGWGSALQAAAEGGQLDVLKLLVSRGADIDLPSNESGCVLASAVRCMSLRSPTRCLVYLLDAGADINRRGGGDHGTALNEAAERLLLSSEHFRILLGRGADVNAPSGRFGFPLQAACSCYGLAEVKLLLDAGAEVNAQGGRRGNALQAACATGSIEVVRMLLNRGAKVDAQGGHFGILLGFACAGRQPFTDISMLLLEHDADGNSQGGFFGSAWHAAVGKLVGEYTQGLEQLLDFGFDVDDARGKERPSALRPSVRQAARLDEILFSTAGEAARLRGRMRLFIAHGADVNLAAGKFGFLLQPAPAIFLRENTADLEVKRRDGHPGLALQAATWTGRTRLMGNLLPEEVGVHVRAAGSVAVC
ncbi:hypothetical protein V8C44DRAFT_353803 [Trichoderma aethiopicum]